MIEAPRKAEPQKAAPGDGRPPGEGLRAGTVDERLRNVLWLVVCCMALAMLAFVTRPGSILADTKIDMAINPVGFLERATQLWDPSQFGQLQNQAFGYFFPMGPFFVIGKLMVLPAWVTQRLFIGALLITAFLGTVRFASRVGIGTPATRIAAGLAYALAPRALTLVGVNSGEFLPAAMLPLVLIPLVRLLRHGNEMDFAARLRAAAQSAAAVALCSGMNAASVAAILTVAVIYVLTGERAWSRWRVLGWWVPLVVLATIWWTIPLLLLGKYGVSILPYSESAQVTTSVTSLSNMVRGVEDWNAYLVVNGSAWWPVGYFLSTAAVPTVATGLVAGLGVAGLLSRRAPERRFLCCALLAGLVIVGSGYVSGLGNPLAASIDHLINGPLAPLRNLRKFDPLIRLPIALGLAQLLASVPQLRQRTKPVRQWMARPWSKITVTVLAAVGLALVALPAYTDGVSQAGDFASVPSYWTSAASWLDAHADNQPVLELPGARFGEYIWGRPMDDILQPLFDGDWASDQLSAIGSVGNTRLLDAVEQRMDAGDGSAGLTELLARMGVKYLLVRNDLIRSDLYGAWPSRIHDAIYASPGLYKVAQFGQFPVGTNQPNDAVSNFDSPFPPVEIFQVYGTQPIASVVPAASTVRVYGGPDSLLTMADLGILKGRPVLLNNDSPGITASQSLVTDSLRKVLRNFGEIRIDSSQTLTARDPLSTFEAADDYLEPPWLPDESVAEYHGIANVTASSSASDVTALPGQSATGDMPFSAIDGNPQTMWESGGLTGPVHQWLQVDFDHPVDPGAISVAFADSDYVGPAVTRVTVQTSAGSLTEGVRETSRAQQLQVPAGPARWLRITVAAVAPEPFSLAGAQVGISEISVPGVRASRTITAPAVRAPGDSSSPRAWASVLLAKAQPQPSGCMLTSLRWVCSPSLLTATEEQYGFDEGFTSSAGHSAALTGQAIMTSTRLITRYSWPGKNGPHVTVSSTYTGDPEDIGSSAFDGSLATAWISGATDRHPVLTIRWHGARTVRTIDVIVPPGATSPDQVEVSDRARQVGGGFVGENGKLTLPRAVRTDQLTLTFTPSQLPVQVSEVVIPGVKSLQANPFATVNLRCGLGPTLSVDGRRVPTKATGSVSDLLNGRALSFTACRRATVTPGQNTVEEPAADPTGWDVQSVLVGPSGRQSLTAAAPVVSTSAPVAKWTDSSREIFVTATHRSYLVVAQNYNAGWQASLNRKVLRPVRLDGWEQAWLLPAGSYGYVTMTYPPDSVYRDTLFGGLALLVLIIGIAVVPRRRRRGPVGRTEPEMASPDGTDGTDGTDGAAGGADGLSGVAGPRRAGWLVRLAVTGLVTAGLAVLGLWLAGWPGAAALPAASFLFLVATRHQWRPLSSRWLAAALLLAAAAGGTAGDLLRERGESGALVTALWDVGPQLLCLIVVGRIAAELIARWRSPDDPQA